MTLYNDIAKANKEMNRKQNLSGNIIFPFIKSKHKKTQKKNISLKKAKHFHKNKKRIGKIILSKVDDNEIIYGARALNVRFPPFLDKHTQDFDIFSTTPKKDAREVERALDKAFGGDHFYTQPAMHPGTWKVKAHANQEGYVDYTKLEEHIPYDTIRGKKYVKLSHVKKHIKKTLKDPEATYRHDKDKDALNRIKIYENSKRR